MAQSESGSDGPTAETYRQMNDTVVARGVPGGRAICDYCSRGLDVGDTVYVHASEAAADSTVWVSWIVGAANHDEPDQPDMENAFVAEAELAEVPTGESDPEAVHLTNVREPGADAVETTPKILQLINDSERGDTFRVTLGTGREIRVTMRSDDYQFTAFVDVKDGEWDGVGILSNPILCGAMQFRYDGEDYDVERVEPVE